MHEYMYGVFGMPMAILRGVENTEGRTGIILTVALFLIWGVWYLSSEWERGRQRTTTARDRKGQ